MVDMDKLYTIFFFQFDNFYMKTQFINFVKSYNIKENLFSANYRIFRFIIHLNHIIGL